MNEKYSQRQFSTLTGIARATLQLWAKNGKLAPAIEINGKKFYSDAQKEIALRLYSSKNTSPTATDVPEQNVGNLTETALAASNSRLKAFREVAQNEKVTNGEPETLPTNVGIEGTAADENTVPDICPERESAAMSDNQNEKINSDTSKNSGDLSNGEVSTENILANLPKRKPHNTRDILAKMAGVSSRTFGKVEKIEKLATAEIKAALRASELSIDAAYKGVLAGATTVDEVKEFKRRNVKNSRRLEFCKTPPAPVELSETPTTLDLAPASNVTIEMPPFIEDMKGPLEEKTLQELANEGRLCFERGDDCLKQGAMYYVEGGRRLIEAKRRLKHGQWQKWLSENFPFSQDTAENRMKLAERIGDTAKSETFRNLKLATLIKLLALPAGDETAFVEVQSEAGKPIEDLSAREVQKAVAQWNQHREAKKTATFSSSEKTNNGGKIAAVVVAPCVEEESISEETAPASPAVNPANGTVAPCVEKRTLNEKFRIMSHETYTNIREMIEETNDLQTAKIIHDSLLELAQGISEVILLLESRIAELLNLNGGDSDD